MSRPDITVVNYNIWSSVFDYVVGLDIHVTQHFHIFLVYHRPSCVLVYIVVNTVHCTCYNCYFYTCYYYYYYYYYYFAHWYFIPKGIGN